MLMDKRCQIDVQRLLVHVGTIPAVDMAHVWSARRNKFMPTDCLSDIVQTVRNGELLILLEYAGGQRENGWSPV